MANKNFARKRLATAQSLAANFTTAGVNVDNLDKICWTVATAGITDNTGTFTAQVRIKDDELHTVGDWIDIDFTPAATLADADTTLACFITNTAFSEARLKFSAAGGTPNGTAQIWVKAERVG